MATLTIADLDNGKRDLETVDAVANSSADTTTTRYGDSVLTLAGALRRLGYRPPVAYVPGLNIDSGLITVERDGVIYAPNPSLLPFTTGAWSDSQWYVVQGSAGNFSILGFSSRAEAESSVVTSPPGQYVVIFSDIQNNGRRTLNQVDSGGLVFLDFLDSADLEKRSVAAGDLSSFGSTDFSRRDIVRASTTFGDGFKGVLDPAEFDPGKAGTNLVTNDVLHNKWLQFDAVGNAFRNARVVLALTDADPSLVPGSDVTLLVQKLIKYVKNRGIVGACILFPEFPVTMSDTAYVNGMHNVTFAGRGISGSYGAFGENFYSTVKWVGQSNVNAFMFDGFGTYNTVTMLQVIGAQSAIYFKDCIGWKAVMCTLRGNSYGILATGGGVGYAGFNSIRENSVGIALRRGAGDSDVAHNDIGTNLIGVQVATGDCRVAFNNIFSSVRNAGASLDNYGGVGIEWRGDLGSDSDSTIFGGDCGMNLIAENGTQVRCIGSSSSHRNIVGVNIHDNWIHQADNGGSGFDPDNPYGRGILVQHSEKINIKNNPGIIGCRDYAVRVVGSFDGGTSVHGNTMQDTQGDDIAIDASHWVRVSENNCIGGTGVGVKLDNQSAPGDFSQNNRIQDNTFKDKDGSVYLETSGARSNMVLDNLGGGLSQYVLSSVSPNSCLRHLAQGGNQESHKNLPVVNV